MNNARLRARLIRTRRRRSFSHVYYVLQGCSENMRKPNTLIQSPQLKRANIVRLLQQSERGGPKISDRTTELGVRRMIESKMFKEHVLPLSTNKIFCSQWLPDDRIVMGTKCNQLLVYNISNYTFTFLPKFENSKNHHGSPSVENGIHSIHVNPSNTCLVTGGPHSNDVAVYTLPDLQPLCLGENAHKDWVFDLKWLDDEHFVSGSRDGKIALWSISNRSEELWNPEGYYYIRPVSVKNCELADKVRSISFQPCSALTTLSSNSYLHHWDMQRFIQLSSHKLPYSRETVSLAHSPEHNLFAVGSSSHITFVDGRSHAFIRSTRTKYRESSVRSLSFKGNIVTVGTGFGMVHFYDLCSEKYMENSECIISQVTGQIPHIPEELFVHTAVYTHCYDTTGTRLFTAGGPWALNVNGSYAAFWM